MSDYQSLALSLPDIVGYFPHNEASGFSMVNLAGSPSDTGTINPAYVAGSGIYVNSPTLNQTSLLINAPSGAAVLFGTAPSGTDPSGNPLFSYAYVSGIPALPTTGNTGISFIAFLKLTSISAFSAPPIDWSAGLPVLHITSCGFYLNPLTPARLLNFQTGLPDGSGGYVTYPVPWVADTSLHMFVGVVDRPAHQVRIYIDGALALTVTRSDAENIGFATSGLLLGYGFLGEMQCSEILYSALSDSQVSDLYSMATGVIRAQSAMSGISIVDARGCYIAAPTANLLGTGQLTPVGGVLANEPASLAGQSTMTAAAVQQVRATVSMSAADTWVANSFVSAPVYGQANLTASSTLAANASGPTNNAANLVGIDTLVGTASVVRVVKATAALHGIDTIAAAGQRAVIGTVHMTGVDTVAANGLVTAPVYGQANLHESSTLTARTQLPAGLGAARGTSIGLPMI